ncbi:expressed unknown protein [Seminavis robusta]|uniref:Uncharacterized protein n=1 Tax=Seminavis robusta TaxID=568900 RepID=A0A9N8EDK5_9STRA|nr:expressed unknown protein [Seminavis robusta]|eukprot:Sro1021_g232200.1 n/a (177) ;mRNA; f:5148-5678
MRRTLSVTFGENYISELALDDSSSLKNELYWSKDEMREIRQDVKLLVETQGCARGLEFMDCCPNHSKTRRVHHVKTVLALQEEHRDHDLKDEKGLQRLASALSKPNKEEAQYRASLDSADAFTLHVEQKLTRSLSFLSAKDVEEYSKPTKSSLRANLKRASTMPSTRADGVKFCSK